MPYNIKAFQNRYNLTNKDIAEICSCSLPTIQKWRSGEVKVSGAASQLMKLLESKAEGDAKVLRQQLKDMDQAIEPVTVGADSDLENLENSMNQVVDRLEYMLENRRKEKELAESEARYRSMVNSYANPVCRWLPDTTLTFVNEAYQMLFAHQEEKIVGKKWIEFVPEELRQSYMIIISDMIRRGEEEISIHEVPTIEGKSLQIEWRDIPIRNEAGKVVEMHSIGYDVTELIGLRRMKDESIQTKRAFLDLSTNPFVIFNDDGQFIETNEAFVRDVIHNQQIRGIGDMLSGSVMGKFKRLLKRVRGKEAFCFQLKLDVRAFRMSGRLIARDRKNGSKYLARFEELSEFSNRVTHVRLSNEVIVAGKVHEVRLSNESKNKIQDRMNVLGKTVDVDRVYVFTFDWEDKVFNNIMEWCARGIESHIDELQQFPISEYPWWTDKLVKNQWIKFEDTSKMPRSAFREREVLVAQGIRSILVAPVIVDGTTIGFVGFDHNQTERIWHEQEQKSLEKFKREIEIFLRQGLQ